MPYSLPMNKPVKKMTRKLTQLDVKKYSGLLDFVNSKNCKR